MPGTKPATFLFSSVRRQPITQRRVAKLILPVAEMNVGMGRRNGKGERRHEGKQGPGLSVTGLQFHKWGSGTSVPRDGGNPELEPQSIEDSGHTAEFSWGARGTSIRLLIKHVLSTQCVRAWDTGEPKLPCPALAELNADRKIGDKQINASNKYVATNCYQH